jgi:hypothetical protein
LGTLLFLPVPTVLLLFTRQPLGLRLSLGLGVVLLCTHRLYARPFALRHARTRCLWCARPLAHESALARTLRVHEPFGETEWRACGTAHHARLSHVLGWAQAHGVALRVGILGALLTLLGGLTWQALDSSSGPTGADAVALFQFGVALSVLPLASLGTRARRSANMPPKVPFPVHIQALIGTAAVLWLFRVIGVLWLVLALRHAGARLGWF